MSCAAKNCRPPICLNGILFDLINRRNVQGETFICFAASGIGMSCIVIPSLFRRGLKKKTADFPPENRLPVCQRSIHLNEMLNCCFYYKNIFIHCQANELLQN